LYRYPLGGALMMLFLLSLLPVVTGVRRGL
jgi:hypothetical protein